MDGVMRIPDLHKFSNDLRDLYIKVKDNNVEDLFIKVAQTYNQNLQQWLSSETTIRLVKPQLRNPEVYDALLTLKKMRAKHPISISIPEVIAYFDKSKASSMFPIIVSFASVKNDKAESVLAPFSDIIITCSSFSSDIEIPIESITEDLITVHDSFMENFDAREPSGVDEYKKSKKKTIKQKKIDMFSGMLRLFSGEIEGAARRIGKDDFANALAKGVIVNPNGISKYVKTGNIDPYMWNEARRILKSVMANLGDTNVAQNYNFAKERCMYFMSMIDEKDLLSLYDQRRQEVDMSKFMDEDNPMDDSTLDNIKTDIKSISVTDAQLLNPDYLAMVSAFFISFYSFLK